MNAHTCSHGLQRLHIKIKKKSKKRRKTTQEIKLNTLLKDGTVHMNTYMPKLKNVFIFYFILFCYGIVCGCAICVLNNNRSVIWYDFWIWSFALVQLICAHFETIVKPHIITEIPPVVWCVFFLFIRIADS